MESPPSSRGRAMPHRGIAFYCSSPWRPQQKEDTPVGYPLSERVLRKRCLHPYYPTTPHLQQSRQSCGLPSLSFRTIIAEICREKYQELVRGNHTSNSGSCHRMVFVFRILLAKPHIIAKMKKTLSKSDSICYTILDLY